MKDVFQKEINDLLNKKRRAKEIEKNKEALIAGKEDEANIHIQIGCFRIDCCFFPILIER
ncbi:hypothetical protein AB4X15_05195 [Peribacillus simplex]|uniref:hypothetical protein n=1 Tax=Peribacillus TaxID=2675229 RepID=UPI00177C0CE4|nr:hypothetical protein [Brevibacillus sp. JNUCC-41]QOS88221.1 hypothetical protein JNUCC41_15325 [Brevibacillus sp. JNUCC-41]